MRERLSATDDAASARARCRAVVVCHRPDPAVLDDVLAAVAPQVAGVLVVANDGTPPAGATPASAEVLVPDRNLGLGAAYNAAARWASAHGATHLLLLDQDSVPAADMVARLHAAVTAPPDGTGRVAAAGPLWRDRAGGRDGHFVRLGRRGLTRLRPSAGAVVETDFLLSSGSLIDLDALDDVGPFDAALFIEHVDTDWSLRVRAAGWRLLGVADARLDHALGHGRFPGLPGRLAPRVAHYPPERSYWLVRNSVALWRRPYAPSAWRRADLFRTAGLVAAHLVFAPQRLCRLRHVLRGLRDGRHLAAGAIDNPGPRP